jgi:hypothetical protein
VHHLDYAGVDGGGRGGEVDVPVHLTGRRVTAAATLLSSATVLIWNRERRLMKAMNSGLETAFKDEKRSDQVCCNILNGNTICGPL